MWASAGPAVEAHAVEHSVRSFRTSPDDQVRSAILAAADLESLVRVLERLLNSGVSVWIDGSLYFIRQRVAAINGLKFEVYPNDHMPPHFHLVGPGFSASFSLSKCTLLAGKVDSKDERLVQWFYKNGGREKLQAAWDATRPGG